MCIDTLYRKERIHKEMFNTVRKMWNWLTTVLVVAVVILAILLVGVRVAGIQVYTVLSGSMEPTYQVGSLIYVRPVDPFKLEPGDPITFMLSADTVATHRIVEVVPDENDSSVVRFRTKGDANEVEDGSLVHYKNVIGKPIASIPKLGYFANYIQHPPGSYLAISAGAILVLMVFIPDLFASEEEQKKNKKKHKKKDEDSNDADSYTEQDCENTGENLLNPEFDKNILEEVN